MIKIGMQGRFTPRRISSLVLWIDATRSTVTKDGSDFVSQIDDLSGQGNHFVQATGSAQPKWEQAVINGLDSIHFDGSGDTLTCTPDIEFSGTAMTSFAAYKPDISTNNGQLLAWKDSMGSDQVLRYQGNVPWLSTANTLEARKTISARTTSSSAAVVQSGTTVTLYDNGNSLGTGTVNNVAYKFSAIGSYATPPTQLFDGYIGEAISYDATLSATQIAWINTYLNKKWGVS